ncbi:MAG: hybrid sensor histidine kinase/response regulator [Spirochaetaceae bacterium]|nr:MAG: hybrid sensor histidine kinase/response regulator [Spirochaetaceae bacterium]
MTNGFNTRVLVIDDEEAIRDSFREILMPHREKYAKLEQAGAELFGTAPRGGGSGETFDFEFIEAPDGESGLHLVEQAIQEEQPFAAIFVDMRMPGWDGLETVKRIRAVDQRAEIVFVTAYSDYSIEEVVISAGPNVGYHTKPFASEEIRQIATKAVYEWNKTRNLEQLIGVVSQLRAERGDTNHLLQRILHHISILGGSESVMVARATTTQGFRKVLGIGQFSEDDFANEQLAGIPPLEGNAVEQNDHRIFLHMHTYTVVVLLEPSSLRINSDRLYLLQLFAEHASQTLEKAELQDSLMQKEKLSAVGQAVSMIAHDLRSPLSGVLSLVDLIRQTDYEPDSMQEVFGQISEAVNSAIEIVNDILDFTRNSDISRNLISSDGLIEEVESATANFVSSMRAELVIEKGSSFTFLGDNGKMRRVLVNLVRNAGESLPRRPRGESRITLRSEFSGEYGIFEVEDNGTGIPHEVQETMFVPFSGGGKRGGTGLGLAIVKSFVEAHAGSVEYETDATGTCFRLRVPARVVE